MRWHEIAPTLNERERAVALELAADDARLARADKDPDRRAPTPARLLLDAAGDARRLGYTHALSTELLQALAVALWREEHGATSPPEFGDAPVYACAPLRHAQDGVLAMIPLDHEPQHQGVDDAPAQAVDGGLAGYALADYLEQHLARTRRLSPVPDRVWTNGAGGRGHASSS